jgi:citrate synthase
MHPGGTMAESAVISNGLEGVVVATTNNSDVDGQRGQLIIRGRDAEELAFNSTFEQTCSLLWSDVATVADDDLQNIFAEGRAAAFKLLSSNTWILQQHHPMDALRTAVSMLDSGTEVSFREYARITAAASVFVSNWSRIHNGLELQAPDINLSQAADFLKTVRNSPASEAEVKGLDTYLTTISDHGMNASTFAARVVASTESDNISCIVAAIGALKGPLHGGAPGPVLEMLTAIGQPENAERWLNQELDSGKKIMGMGHRIYKVRDPRAAIFEQAISRLEQSGLRTSRLALARAVEAKAEKILAERKPNQVLKANVEFYTAVLLDALQIPHSIFSSTFAVGRVAGWFAHIAEQRSVSKLIRPASQYTGPRPKP